MFEGRMHLGQMYSEPGSVITGRPRIPQRILMRFGRQEVAVDDVMGAPMLVGAPDEYSNIIRLWTSLLSGSDSEGMRGSHAEPLGNARIRLGSC